MSFDDLSDNTIFKIALKLNYTTLCKFRRMTKKIENVVENHRYQIMLSPKGFDTFMIIDIKKDKYICHIGSLRKELKQPFEQTSCFSFYHIRFKFKDDEPMNKDALEELTILIKKLRLAPEILEFRGQNLQKEVVDLGQFIDYKNQLNLNCFKSFPFSKIVKSPTLKKGATFFNVEGKIDHVDVNDFCESIRNFSDVEIKFLNDDNEISINAFESIIKEIHRCQELNSFPTVAFIHNGIKDMNFLCKGMTCLRRSSGYPNKKYNMRRQDIYNRFKIYSFAKPLGDRILIVGFACWYNDFPQGRQGIGLRIIENSYESFKNYAQFNAEAFGDELDTPLIDYMYENLMAEK